MTTSNRQGAAAGAKIAAGGSEARNVMQRVASAAVLGPIALVAAYFGGWLFLGLCAVAAGLILWEWTALVAGGADWRILVPGWAALLATMALVAEIEVGAAVVMIAIGAVLAGGIIAALPRRYPAANPAVWAVAGVAYAGVALLGAAVLRSDPQWGFAALLFLFATVWATDIFAYLIGRAIGGPLLWPTLSPHKTWAGAIGGAVGGVVAGAAVAYASVGTGPVAAGVLALVLSIATQGGDLFESAVKRRFGAKDAGHLIPGHGGAMDRLDGFLAAALVGALIGLGHQGPAAPGLGLLVW